MDPADEYNNGSNQAPERQTPQKKSLPVRGVGNSDKNESLSNWAGEESEDGELTVDVYQTANEIIIKTMVAGVRPEDLDITITRDMVTIRGKRETEKSVSDDDYFH